MALETFNLFCDVENAYSLTVFHAICSEHSREIKINRILP